MSRNWQRSVQWNFDHRKMKFPLNILKLNYDEKTIRRMAPDQLKFEIEPKAWYTAHKINDHVLCPIEFHGSPTWWKTGSPESFLGCPNYFGLSKKVVFLFMNTKLHRNVLLVQMRLSIMLNSNIHAIVRRLLKTWNRLARGLLNLGEGRARGIRRQNESEWIPVPWKALGILQSCTNPSKWACQFTCRSCLWSLLCLIDSLFGLTSNFQRKHQISATLPLCVGNPPVTGSVVDSAQTKT